MGVKVVKTQGPYYVFFSIEDFHISSEVFADRLLEEVHVAVLPGKYFYYENHIRMSCCIDLVKCKEGSLWFNEVHPAGKKVMPAEAFANGRGLKPGDGAFKE